MGADHDGDHVGGGAAGCWGRRRRWLPADVAPPVVAAFQVVPRRWVVERTFGWLGRFRRLSQVYEFLPATSEATIYLAMIQILLHRLAAQ